MLGREPIEIHHELVNGLFHVHMSELGPYRIILVQQSFFLLNCTECGLYFVPVELRQLNAGKWHKRSAPVGGTSIEGKEVVDHCLVRELVQERRHRIHRPVNNEENRFWSTIRRWLSIGAARLSAFAPCQQSRKAVTHREIRVDRLIIIQIRLHLQRNPP